ncbi:methyl-CpG-binding domain protein 1 isoform X3 [Alligator mississippiensis]|uniref:methyl-CpG-binding domain protein 1 isoform X3 n=1 Tax=Alligator mississippiensis TaxID=8496 RepID=UPI00287737EE|nr:methyl-CpG-binding domain protein 1 isoform X3 [Alligator mississippiensis]
MARRRRGPLGPTAPRALCGASSAMAQDWVDCPALGPGWKRREAFRKSGATCGRTDTYYQSPTGAKFRSKIELSKFLGTSQDLTHFDFKKGIIWEPTPQVRKGTKRHLSLPDTPELPVPEPKNHPEEVPLEPSPPGPEPPEPLPPLKQESPPPEPHEEPELQPLPEQWPLPERRSRKRPPVPPEPLEPPLDGVVACCASCQTVFPGVTLPAQRRCRWLCPDCRAQRRDFNREQRFFKRVGCGLCQACQIPEDCGICTACTGRGRGPGPASGPATRPGLKCLLRRCLKIVKKGFGCGACQGCQNTEDCGTCYICLRRLKPGLKRQWRCLQRRCLKRKKSVVAKKGGYGSRKLMVKQLNKVKDKKKLGRPPKHPSARASAGSGGRRRRRRCGVCEACVRRVDCGCCDFCRDKPKFGGDNLKRQKCRWRQCLRLAMKRLLPGPVAVAGPVPGLVPGPGRSGGVGGPGPRRAWRRRRRRRSSACGRRPAPIAQPGRRRWAPGTTPPQDKEAPAGVDVLLGAEKRGSGGAEPPGPLALVTERPGRDLVLLPPVPPRAFPLLLQRVKEEPAPAPPLAEVPEPSASLPDLGFLIASAPRVKQEKVEPSPGEHSPATLVSVPSPQAEGRGPGGDVVVLDETEEDEEEEPTPVIMEVLSLGTLALGARRPPPPEDAALRRFLAELQEIPLPAHWEVVPPRGEPDLRLVQRSARSTVASAVIRIRPGLFFQVVACDLPVPPEHQLYAGHPPRLTTVDEVVELICDLEAYRLCPGCPAGPRSPACAVLVYAGPCPRCRSLEPWPSGAGPPPS